MVRWGFELNFVRCFPVELRTFHEKLTSKQIYNRNAINRAHRPDKQYKKYCESRTAVPTTLVQGGPSFRNEKTTNKVLPTSSMYLCPPKSVRLSLDQVGGTPHTVGSVDWKHRQVVHDTLQYIRPHR